MNPQGASEQILSEYHRAAEKFPPFNSPHEGLAVLMEAFEELKAEVFPKNASRTRMTEEAIQVGAMAIRFLVDLP